ncbi:MAG: Gfo/Idh/MocA family oxidoreductase [Alphaproteobacteria bacterium]|nr:Gfo/Idh/MocA family oxidoreductase [Alphaproteobacteria bacterium]MBL7099797.1 Gfo/Idh/MocA family oxidoreductase [Alphaproteobacteria bacterium]
MLKFGLVGCGRIAKRHADILATSQVAGACLAAVCDVAPERARRMGESVGVPHFGNLHDMMKSCELDVVSILTPSGTHAQNVLELAPYGKHVVVEKPMALTLADADAMIAACLRNGIKLFVVKQNRFNVPVVKLRDALEAGRFGKLILGTVRVRWCRTQAYYDQDSWRGTWEQDGGVLANQASHHVDLLEWMMGDVESVFAKGITALARVETEDTAIATLKFRSGALGLVEATTAVRPKDLEGSISILGETGSVEIGGFAVNELKTWNFAERLDEDATIPVRYSVNPPDVYGFGHKAYYDHVVDCILRSGQILVDGVEGRRSLELITAIYESIESGREVHLPFRPSLSRLGRSASDKGNDSMLEPRRVGR